ncbi:hypothetical protein ACFQGE_16710 [Halomicroarcula sp. GCM10025817]|uniref:hypothetical protein n=1 Tax=Haloarcula TaxID=2237 RepID=UPI0023E8BA55|nr:hypothetical protein [Halomicroarcula sp. SYNS111]
MALQIGRAISNGVRRSLSPVGIVLIVLTAVYVLLFSSSVNTIIANQLPPDVQQQAQIGLTLPLSSVGAGVVGLAALVFGMVLYIAAARAFTRTGPDRGSVTGSLFTRRIGRALVSAVGANIVIGIATFIGFLLLVIPGIFLMVSFAFGLFVIAVEDARLMASLRRSWDIARENRWRLAGLLLLVGVVTGLISSLGSVVSFVSPTAGQVVSLLVTTPLVVVNYAIIADAYLQLRDGGSGVLDQE